MSDVRTVDRIEAHVRGVPQRVERRRGDRIVGLAPEVEVWNEQLEQILDGLDLALREFVQRSRIFGAATGGVDHLRARDECVLA